ncbi:helix-turn-helix domain-containing protein [Lentzea sp. NPDC058436]|uniref:helix-turn-helix domain-containing protein n=1 Tax=Lentzea sp. NPDC058436 TaxID=3346499 RepID=UPI00364EBCAE
MREFGELLRTHRIGAGLTQQQLADFAMVSVRAIRDLECGRTRSPRAETVRLLADGLRLDEGSRADLQQAGGRSAGRAAVAPPAPGGPGGLIVGREAEAAALAALLTEGSGGGGVGAAGSGGAVDGRARGSADESPRAVGAAGSVGERARGLVDESPRAVGGAGAASPDDRRQGLGGAAAPMDGRARMLMDGPCAGAGGASSSEAHLRAAGATPAEGRYQGVSGVGVVSADAEHQVVRLATQTSTHSATQAAARTEARALAAPYEPRRLITITGVSGVGKTRLALEVAGELHFRHGWSVLWHPTQATPTVDDDHDTVLVTDHRPDPRLLDAHPRLRVIVTALAPTGLPGEHVFPLGALADDAAVRLLLTHVHRVRPAFKPEPANQAALMGLVHALDGLPSALEFAAGWFMVYSPQHLLERLRSHPLDPTSAHLRDSLRRSLSTVDEEARMLLVRMAEGEEAGYGRALRDLCVRGLVRRAGSRYEVLSLVRAAVLEPVAGPHLPGSVALTWPV